MDEESAGRVQDARFFQRVVPIETGDSAMLREWCTGFGFGYDGLMPDIRIRLEQLSDRDQLVRMRQALWPTSSAEEHARELTQILEGKAPVMMPLIILGAEASDRILAGFLEIDLRSHADGCNPIRPVGYIEGWYVAENHRNRGIGRKLLAAAEDWARSQGCVEIASDTWITMKCPNPCMKRWGTR